MSKLMALQVAYVDFMLDNLVTQDVPQIALEAMQAGYDSPSLTILAGMSTADDPDQIKAYLQRALLELDQEVPERKTAIATGLKFYLQEIADGTTDPIVGMRLIYDKYLKNHSEDTFGKDKKYAYDAINKHIAKLYGLLNNYEDSEDADFIDRYAKKYSAVQLRMVRTGIKTAIVAEAQAYLNKGVS